MLQEIPRRLILDGGCTPAWAGPPSILERVVHLAYEAIGAAPADGGQIQLIKRLAALH